MLQLPRPLWFARLFFPLMVGISLLASILNAQIGGGSIVGRVVGVGDTRCEGIAADLGVVELALTGSRTCHHTSTERVGRPVQEAPFPQLKVAWVLVECGGKDSV